MLLTQKCYNDMADTLYRLRYTEAPKFAEHIDECRSNGSIDDNPEYYQAIEDMNRLNKKIDEIAAVLTSATIFTDNMKRDDTVTFGSTVTFVNAETNKKVTYTI